MDAVEYLKEAERMCDTIGDCDNCPFNDRRVSFPCKASNASLEAANPKEAVETVEKWTAEHPKKTRQSEFLKMFPRAPLNPMNGMTISISPCEVDGEYKPHEGCDETSCSDCQREYWSEEVED